MLAPERQAGVALSAFLARLIWLCVLPLMLLAAWLAYDSVRGQERWRDTQARNLARNTATTIDLFLEARINALNMLAASPLADDPAQWPDLYRDAQGFQRSFGSHVVFSDVGEPMRMLFNTRVPYGTALPDLPRPKGYAAAPAAVASGHPAVGDTFFGPIAGETVVAIAVPALRQGKVTHLLLTTLEARQLQQRIERQSLPEGWALSLVDGRGEVIASRVPEGFDAQRDIDASGRYTVRSAMSPWSVVVEIPRDAHRAPLLQTALALGLGVLGATLIGVLGGTLAGRRLGRSVAALVPAPSTEMSQPDITEVAAARRLLDEISDRRTAAETQLRKLSRVIEQTASTVVITDAEGVIEYVNPRFTETSGYAAAEVIGRRPSVLKSGHTTEAEYAVLWRTIRAGEVWHGEFHNRRRDGTLYWEAATITPIRDGDGRVTHFAGIKDDVTERKEMEAALKEMQVEAEQLMERHVASQTAAAIAHELNQPLIAVASYAEAALRLLRSGNPPPDKLRHAIEGSARQAQRAGQVVRELLAFMEVGEVRTEPVDLNDLVRTVLAQVETNVADGFRAQITLEPGLPPVCANRLQVEKVLANLVQNGHEAMRDAGIGPHPMIVTVRTGADGGMAQVTVRDSGPGIDEQAMRRIFDPFFTTKQHGIGMGLAISRAIIEAHGGQLWLEPDMGPGATFHFTLPFVT